eukprot:SAG22_NODE_532_length_9401_cov_29.999892_5_plen_176_part_00
MRDYIHPADLATAHISALRLLQASGGKAEIFNLGNGEGSTVKEVLAAVERASGKKIEAESVPRRAGDPAKVSGNSGAPQRRAPGTAARGAHPLKCLPTLLWCGKTAALFCLASAVILRPKPCEHDLEVEAGVRLGRDGGDGVEVALNPPNRVRGQPALAHTTAVVVTKLAGIVRE